LSRTSRARRVKNATGARVGPRLPTQPTPRWQAGSPALAARSSRRSARPRGTACATGLRPVHGEAAPCTVTRATSQGRTARRAPGQLQLEGLEDCPGAVADTELGQGERAAFTRQRLVLPANARRAAAGRVRKRCPRGKPRALTNGRCAA